MDKRRLEIIVGTFVVVGTLIFAFFVFFVGGIYFFKPGYHLDVGFNYVSGVSAGAPVRYSGVPVGEVVSLETIYDEETEKPEVMIRIWVKKGVIVREKTVIEIRGAFALSEAHLEITSGGKADGKILEDGDFIVGLDPTPIDNLIREGEVITRKLQEMLGSVTEFVTDDEIREGIREVIVNTGALTKNLNKVIGGSEEELTGIIENTNSSAEELLEAIRTLREMMDKVSDKEGTVGKLVNDDELYKELLSFVQELKANPWKLLKKTKEKNPDGTEKKTRRFLFF